MGNEFIQWASKNIQSGNIVSYHGSDILEIIALAKLVD